VLQLSQEHPNADIVVVGRKAHEFFQKRAGNLTASFTRFSDVATMADAEPLANWLLERYKTHRCDKVLFCSTVFISALKQRVEVHEILPVTLEALEKIIKGIVSQNPTPYVLEPTKTLIFEKLVEELVKVEIAHLVFEANASEHSSRMLAMKNATDNAQELQARLTLALNKARQGSITQELAEITSAKEALTST
jgi:F-type H+-transporting ATPase subunit gamma